MSKIIAVVGPTATGKSDLAVKLCKKFGGEVVSCDSMQIYKRMDIGTAKPTAREMDSVKHHLIDIFEPGTEYSVSDYVSDASRVCEELNKRGVLPVFCGGTGLYISSFVSGLLFNDFTNDATVRERIEMQAQELGIEALHNKLSEIDPEAAENIAPNNVKRVIRAIEVYETTGVTISEWNRRTKLSAKKRDCLIIGLDYENRDTLYGRIDMRVDKMLEAGLLEETRSLLEDGVMQTKTASQAIAYKELVPYLRGEDSLENCVEALKRNSRRYAKRQLTWFRRNGDIKWIYKDDKSDDEVFRIASLLVEDYLAEDK